MRRLLLSSIVLLSLAMLLGVGCGQQQDDTFKPDTDVYIYLKDSGYSLITAELIWSGRGSPDFDMEWLAVAPDGTVYLADSDTRLYAVQAGQAVLAMDYSGSKGDIGATSCFNFDQEGRLYFMWGASSRSTILEVIDGKIAWDTMYYQTPMVGTESLGYIRGFAFAGDGTLYFIDDWGDIYRVSGRYGTESLYFSSETTKQWNVDHGRDSMAIDGDGALYYTSNVVFRNATGTVSWGSSGPGGVICRLVGGEAAVVCAAINDQTRAVAIGPDGSMYVLAFVAHDSGDNEFRLWKLHPEDERLQTNTRELRAFEIRPGGTSYDAYCTTNAMADSILVEDKKISLTFTNEVGQTNQAVIAVPRGKATVHAESSGTLLEKRTDQSETMSFVLFSFEQTQDVETLILTW